jgi:hypothetical protein
MAAHYPVTVEIDGKTYAGTWTLKQGGRICVGGYFGARTVELGPRKPEDVAAKILRELVKAWLAKEARERKAREAALKRQRP